MRNIHILFVLLFISSHCIAQDSRILEQYIDEGIRNNLNVKKNDLSVMMAIESLRQAKGLFLPELSFNSSYSLAYGGRTLDIPTGDLLNPVYNTLNKLTGSDKFPNIGNTSEMFLPNNYQDNKLGFSIQLLNTDVYYAYKANKEMVSIAQAKKEIYQNELVGAIKVAYFNYLSAQEIGKILELNRKTLVELERINFQFFNHGIKNKDAVYDVRFEISQLDSKTVENRKNIELSKSYFNFLLNRDLDASIETDSLLTNIQTDYFYEKISSNNDVENRREIKMLSKNISLQENLLKMQTYNLWIPKIYLIDNIGFQGFKYKFDSNQFYNFAQINLRWDLYLGGRRLSKKRIAKYQVESARHEFAEVKSKLELEKKRCVEEVITVLQNYKTKFAALESAKESFYITAKKYKEGQVLWLEVMEKQNKYLSAQVQLSVQKYYILIKYAEFEKAIGNF